MSQSQPDVLRILIVDDDAAICRSLQILLEEQGHAVATRTKGGAAVEAVREFEPDIVFLDLRLPDRDGLRVLKDLTDDADAPEVVMITGVQDMKSMIEAIQIGALDYVRKPLAVEDVLVAIEKCRQRRRQRRPMAQRADLVPITPGAEHPDEIVGSDRRILELLKQVGLLSRSQVTVLIEGESGTGKELVARAIHNASSPAEPFVAINCAAIVPTLLESELFGYEKGAFTGADSKKQGRLEDAGSGTLFLDEIGDMPLELQAKLLRALQERTFERVGGNHSVSFEARVLAASHRDLGEMVERGEFREDLLYRLSVARLEIPPLRERPGDIRILATHLLHRIRRRLESEVTAISETALKQLELHSWPGNVRELNNVLTRAVALARADVIEEVDIAPTSPSHESVPEDGPVKKLWEAERDHVRHVLDSTGWNITRTAQVLDISPTTLRKKIVDYELR